MRANDGFQTHCRPDLRLEIIGWPLEPGRHGSYVVPMTLTDSQKDQARQWLADGMKLSDFQKRIEKDFGLKMTYMEARFLVDDLKVLPKDQEPVVKPEPPAAPAGATPAAPAAPGLIVDSAATQPEPAPGGGVDVTVDAVTRPGTMVSGRVKFSDGQGGAWYIDQYGRPGLVADTKGYRPPAPDLQEFQVALERELVRLGM